MSGADDALSASRPGSRRGIVVLPRDGNPYQELLYGEMRALGHRVSYLGELTPSRLANQLLLPGQLLWLRLRGYSVLHIHWVFYFSVAALGNRRGVRRLMRAWFGLTLSSARLLGFRVVWTAHNLLPHAPVFDDDAAARRALVGNSDLVIAHTAAALAEVTERFGDPARGVVIPHGPIESTGLSAIGPLPATAAEPGQPRTVLFFGSVEPYKGVEDLLAAVRRLPPSTVKALAIVVAGRCNNQSYAAQLKQAAAGLTNVTLSLGYVEEADIAGLFASADAVIYPYRRVTTSGAVTLAAVAGRPIVVPKLPGFAELPDAATIRYEAGVNGISDALGRVAAATPADLAARGEAARGMLAEISWERIAELTSAEIQGLA